jgi:copper chaperone CopZ
MKKNYEISGMSCGGCVSNVKMALLELSEITEAVVQLNPPSAFLIMNKSIDIEILRNQLKKAGNYTVNEVIPT